MNKIEFTHLKQFGTDTGAIITMKSLVTIHKERFVECYENNNRYKISELKEII